MYRHHGITGQDAVHMRKRASSVGGRLPADRLTEQVGIDGHHDERRLPAEEPSCGLAHLAPGGAVDESVAAVRRRTLEVPGRLEPGPLRGQQNLVNQHRITVPARKPWWKGAG